MEIAIHSGHNRSLAVLLDKGSIVSRADGETLNLYAVSKKVVESRLTRLFTDLRLPAGADFSEFLGGCSRLVLSLPGAATKDDQAHFRKCVKKAGWARIDEQHLYIADDTWCGLLGGTLQTQGLCAYAGTGASVFVGTHQCFPRGKPYKLDGWGPILGDAGSGFQLGLLGLQEMSRHFDAYGAPSALQIALADVEPALLMPNSLHRWFASLVANNNTGWRQQIAAFGGAILRLADAEMDRTSELSLAASALVLQCAEGISITIAAAVDRFRAVATLPHIWQGWMFNESQAYQQAVNDFLRPKGVELRPPQFFPIVGAMLLAVSPGWRVVTSSNVTSLLDSIRRQPPDMRNDFMPGQ